MLRTPQQARELIESKGQLLGKPLRMIQAYPETWPSFSFPVPLKLAKLDSLQEQSWLGL